MASPEDRIRVSFRLIGMGLSDEDKAGLLEIAAETGGRASFANSGEELAVELARTVEEEQAPEDLAGGPGRYRYLGCYVDKPARDLKGHGFADANMTISMCVATCKGKGFRFAGTQFSRECFCGDAYGTYGRTGSGECNDVCGGRPSEFCGGYWRNSVYAIGDEIAEHGAPPVDTGKASTGCSANFGATAEPVTCTCGPSAIAGSVWGTETYTADSAICRAALHAGALPAASGGTVTVAPAAGCSNYEGTERNGVQSSHWDAFDRSFYFPAASDGQCTKTCPTTHEHADESITCACPPRAMTGSVWGTNTYTSDSSICRAALHAGTVGTSGGTVTAKATGGCASYRGTERNDVRSGDWGSYGRSFYFPTVNEGTCASAAP